MRIFFAALILILYVALCYVCWWHYRRTQRVPENLPTNDDTWLVAYASQGGTAAQLAWQTADQLSEAGLAAQVIPLNKLDEALLRRQGKILFIVSTFGEGEPPDNGNRILSRLARVDLQHMQYGLLALGDSNYRFFCAFGRALHHALHSCGATELFDLIEVDRGDPASLRHWQYYLGQISGQTHFSDWQAPEYEHWTLQRRTCLNPGSPGAPAFWLQLAAPVAGKSWCAGDIAEVGPCNSTERVAGFLRALGRDPQSDHLAAELSRRELPQPSQPLAHLAGLADNELLQKLPALPHREYSIASIPQSGSLDLLVRRVQLADGELGLGSGWLTHHADVITPIALRIRSNPHFHPPAADVPLILVGNGTGMAGLRAHLLARRQSGARRNWLLFGERTAAHDFFFVDDMRALEKEGFVELSLVFSRDAQPGAPRYVQDLLPQHAERLLDWLEAGAAIYVCGSLHGMAQGVDQQMANLVGRDRLEVLAESGRYCRDVY